MSTKAKAFLATFRTGLVNPQSIAAVLVAAYQAQQIKWSEAKEIAKEMEIPQSLLQASGLE